MEKVHCRFAAEERRLGDWLSSHVAAHGCTCCVRAGLNTAVGVELMARQVPSCARNVTHDLFVTLLSHSHLSIAMTNGEANVCLCSFGFGFALAPGGVTPLSCFHLVLEAGLGR